MPSQTGGCACKAVRYEVTAEPTISGACHCRACQYASGGGPTYTMMIPREGLQIVAGEPQVWRSRSDQGVEVTREFCGACGTPLWSHNTEAPDVLALRVRSAGNIWVSTAQPWHPIDRDLPQWDGNPDGPPKQGNGANG